MTMRPKIIPTSCRWVPWAITACFAVVFAVNGTLAYLAVHSDTGLVTAHPFELGNGYNRILAQGEAQDQLGWQAALRFAGTAPQGIIDARVADAAGRPLSGLTVRARIERPLGALPPLTLQLVGADDGHYTAAVSLPRAGLWEVHVIADRADQRFQFIRRIVAP